MGSPFRLLLKSGYDGLLAFELLLASLERHGQCFEFLAQLFIFSFQQLDLISQCGSFRKINVERFLTIHIKTRFAIAQYEMASGGWRAEQASQLSFTKT